MRTEASTDQLTVIANLLAMQVVKDKGLEEAAWTLKLAGMKYSEIGRVLDISENAVSAHVSNRKKKQENESGTKARRKKNE
jgi:DNA-binding CsgD family transcriptional regulator